MTSKIKHLAIVSDQYALLGRFYQALFGLRPFEEDRAEGAVAVTDGYVGLNIGPRRPGRQAGFDHFGFLVDDMDAVFERAAAFPTVKHVKRSSTKAFAGISMHDPAGNVFDLSATSGLDEAGERPLEVAERHVSHFVLKVMQPAVLARFYVDVFGLVEESSADASICLSDGHLRMILSPWDITDFARSGIERPALEHLGFSVGSLDEFTHDVQRLAMRNPVVGPRQIAVGPEGQARVEQLRQCQLGQYQLADPDGVLLDVAEAGHTSLSNGGI
jgi:predicted enzyme related to lactoylglutathione lyase